MEAFSLYAERALDNSIGIKRDRRATRYRGTAVSAAVVTAILHLQIGPGMVLERGRVEGEEIGVPVSERKDRVMKREARRDRAPYMLGQR